MTKTVLVVVAHADDEVLGCGATLARHAADGDAVHVVYVADGVSSRGEATAADLTARQQSASAAGAILGVRSTTYLGFPDNRLDTVPLLDIVRPLEVILASVRPEVVYTHHHGDLNVDHRITHQALLTAARPLPGSSLREILAFEVMSSTEWNNPGFAPFLPALFVDVGAHLAAKEKALQAYGAEMRPPPHSRSVEHLRCLAMHRGSCVGLAAAEAFMVVRAIRS
jgi:LmbE family N-acetylglucosaminyl deacetylase